MRALLPVYGVGVGRNGTERAAQTAWNADFVALAVTTVVIKAVDVQVEETWFRRICNEKQKLPIPGGSGF